jgi:hypothetical protein
LRNLWQMVFDKHLVEAPGIPRRPYLLCISALATYLHKFVSLGSDPRPSCKKSLTGVCSLALGDYSVVLYRRIISLFLVLI